MIECNHGKHSSLPSQMGNRLKQAALQFDCATVKLDLQKPNQWSCTTSCTATSTVGRVSMSLWGWSNLKAIQLYRGAEDWVGTFSESRKHQYPLRDSQQQIWAKPPAGDGVLKHVRCSDSSNNIDRKRKNEHNPAKIILVWPTCEPIKISMSRMRVAIMMFYRIWILLTIYWFSNKTIEIGGIMKGKPAIASLKYLVKGFCWLLNCFAFGQG